MGGRFRPLNGADSAEAWEPKPYRCLVKDIEGPSWWVSVTAIGPNDARHQARQKAIDEGAESPGVIDVRERVGQPGMEALG